MKKANIVGVSTTTAFYMMCGCFGYAAFGNNAPGNLLTGFGFYEPFWLVDLANACIVLHLIGAYQVQQISFQENYLYLKKMFLDFPFFFCRYLHNRYIVLSNLGPRGSGQSRRL